QLSETDKILLRAISFNVRNNLSRNAFAELPQIWPDVKIPSLRKIKARLAFLAGLSFQYYDCCIESCMAYTGPLSGLQECMHCGTSRLDEYGKPRRQFGYLPMESRLVLLYRHRSTAEKMFYRANYALGEGTDVADVFDGTNYKTLCASNVVVDGHDIGYKFFCDPHDIALGLSTDGFAPWRRRKKT
ncbi:hypothetical protein C8Q70DRAFT_898649, partial [Cubamyces menziesii]